MVKERASEASCVERRIRWLILMIRAEPLVCLIRDQKGLIVGYALWRAVGKVLSWTPVPS